MKKLITLSLLFFVFAFNKVDAQIESLHISDSSTYCNVYSNYLNFYVGNQLENNPVFTVNWGDGNIETITGGVYSSGQYYWEYITHTYNAVGNFTISASVISSVTGLTITSNIQTFLVEEIGACGNIYPYAYQPSLCGSPTSYYHYSAIYDLIDANEVVQSFQGNLNAVNILNVPYTLRLNQNWLDENNLTQTSPPITITGFNTWGNPIENLSFSVESNTNLTTPDFGFMYAWGSGYSNIEKAWIYLYVANYSCVANGDIRIDLSFPAGLVPNTSNLLNPSIVGNVLSFDLNFVSMYYHTGTWIEFYLPGTTPAGTMLDFSGTITDLSGTETFLTNNIINFECPVYNSYDPNDKVVNKTENINPMEQEELTYTINFQNEGNADALKVVVKDTLSDNLDLSTFEVIRTKHNVVTRIDPATREVKFTFNDIYLAPKDLDEEGSKGYIVYKIKEKVNLPINSEIKNTAYIYFDFNPAIITNTTLNRNTLLSVSEIAENELLTLYPNPVKDKLQIKSTEEIRSITIYTANGVKVMEYNQTTSIDVSKLVNGVYFVEILSDSSMRKEKIVVQH